MNFSAASVLPLLQIVPVLDLIGGQVVRAVRGERSRYRPIVSPLAPGSDPLTLARALLERSGGSTLYVADLDAIAQRPAQAEALAALLAGLPQGMLWLDAGFADPDEAAALAARFGADGARIRPVFGSESLRSLQALAELEPGALLSLDSRAGAPLDPAGCLERPDLWPQTMIVMTLDRVGATEGPDLERFSALRSLAPEARWIGAGGLRSDDDLRAAGRAGADGWLVASALHDGRLGHAAKAVVRPPDGRTR